MAKESWWKGLAVWAVIVIVIVLSLQLFSKQRREEALKFSDFVTALDRDVDNPQRVMEVTVRGDPMRGDDISAVLKDNTVVTTFMLYDEVQRKELRDRLAAKQIPINYLRAEESHFLTNISKRIIGYYRSFEI